MQNSNSVDKNLKDFEALLEKCTFPFLFRQKQPRSLESALQDDELQANLSKGR